MGVEDGVVPAGVSVFDDSYPAVSRLDGTLLTALRSAAVVARTGGVTFVVNSGWRSRAYQQYLLDQAVITYGSLPEARRWVATPATSPHVSGKAIDLGGTGAADWLDRFGATYGLCQIYQNEPWHFEFRAQATMRGCPPSYPDPTHDPRMR
ncbi:MAG TPA: M15 family metallopeptidase [Gordonia sp. (in: high G+C Gram-positive bacteria)]|nr:M15 family metallopeptidase [Gordonia sp. (in: high G+C Gram-positive bacteria)]